MRGAATAAVAVLTMVAASAQAPPGPRWPLTVQPLPSPAAARSGEPQLAASADRLVLSWIEQTGERATLKLAERTATGWSPARVVASGDNWFVNWADVPSVIPLTGGRLAAHWLQKSGPGVYAYDVRLSFSSDGGNTWSPSVTPHHDRTQTEHGFASLFEMPEGALGLVWLDGRAMTPDPKPGQDHGAMTVRAGVFDRSGRQTSEVLLDDRACECCPTAAAVTQDGPIVAFRNRTAEEVRDIYVSRFANGRWTVPVSVHADNWKINACPVNGPALSARGSRVAISWFTVQQDRGRAYVAFSRDSGRSFGSPIRVDDVMSLGRVDVEQLDDGSAVVGWIESANQGAQFRIRRVTPEGDRSPSQVVSSIDAGRASGYPRMARFGRELLFAWTDTGAQKQVRTAIAVLAPGRD